MENQELMFTEQTLNELLTSAWNNSSKEYADCSLCAAPALTSFRGWKDAVMVRAKDYVYERSPRATTWGKRLHQTYKKVIDSQIPDAVARIEAAFDRDATTGGDGDSVLTVHTKKTNLHSDGLFGKANSEDVIEALRKKHPDIEFQYNDNHNYLQIDLEKIEK